MSVVEQLLGFLAYSLVIEDLRVSSVRVFASDLPTLEERIPIEEFNELREIVLSENLSAKERWLNDLGSGPVYLLLLCSSLVKRYEGSLLLAIIVFLSYFFIFFSDVLNVFFLVVGIK